MTQVPKAITVKVVVNQNALVVAVGCYAQVAKEDLEQIEEIDLILGTNEKKDIVNYIEKYLEDNENDIELDDVLHNPEYSDFGAVSYTEKTRAVIKVQDGCDRFCSRSEEHTTELHSQR